MASPTEPAGWDLPESPYHPGELALQERAGVREKIDRQGRRGVRRFMPEQHRQFYPQLPFLFVGSVDDQGQPWASVLVGEPGFVRTPDATTLQVSARPLFGDPLNANLRDGADIAALGLELPTRRRNRVIGVADGVSEGGFAIRVRQTMGVCSQYIQARTSVLTADPMHPQPRPVHRSDQLDESARALIAQADTYFVASADLKAEHGEARGVDIAHRGGRLGFVRIDDERTLTAPEFVGNFMFNTLGNFIVEPRAGLLFVDFTSGHLLYIAAHAEIVWDGPEVSAFAAAQRLVRFHIDQVIRIEAALPLRFSDPEYSPLLAHTGSWENAARTLQADRMRNQWRPFRITRVEDESGVIRSFFLEPADGAGLATYEAGQFLPLRLTLPGHDAPVLRDYTLSDAPGGRYYRISVKRDGRGGASDWLHDHARTGTVIEARGPRGGFTFDHAGRRPAVLISADVGITPMIAMLNSVLVNGGRTRFHNRLIFIHGARNGREHAFATHLRATASNHVNLTTHIRYSHPDASDVLGHTHDSVGRIDLALIKSVLSFDDYDFYLCGPSSFMQDVYDGLTGLGVRNERIHVESLGPASVKRIRAPESINDTSKAVTVHFAKSGRTALWRPRDGSLLEVAEKAGLSVLYGCRAGSCGSCSTRLLAGTVRYAETPSHDVGEGEALICCATPDAGPHLDDGTKNREGVTLDL
jgi:ferredoxin-NADP reductase/predicted pyridoxine 5'-phosphate oxidase superfamily flavin-nucleotide-binding protein